LGLTVIQIAHRLATIKNSDKIFMLDKGKIVEKGDYEHLMGLKGKFYELVKIQTSEADQKKRKKKIDAGKIDLEKEYSNMDSLKLDKKITQMSERYGSLKSKLKSSKNSSIKMTKQTSKKEQVFGPLPVKHLASMTGNWMKLVNKISDKNELEAVKIMMVDMEKEMEAKRIALEKEE